VAKRCGPSRGRGAGRGSATRCWHETGRQGLAGVSQHARVRWATWSATGTGSETAQASSVSSVAGRTAGSALLLYFVLRLLRGM